MINKRLPWNKRLDIREKSSEIINMYEKELFSTPHIANILRCHSTTIRKILKENNKLKSAYDRRRELFDNNKINIYNKIIFTEEQEKEIKRLYLNEFMNSKQIAERLNFNFWVIKAFIRKNNLSIGTSERRKLLFKNEKLNVWNTNLNKDNDLRVMKAANISKEIQQRKKNKTYEEIYGEEKARDIKKKMGEIQSQIKIGEKNPAWIDGRSFFPYPITFNNKFKREIRKRDNHICLKCGKHQEKLSRTLDIHHIDYIKENTFEQNCCALCQRCNLEVNKNRTSWTKFFQSLLSERYGYKYSENRDIIINLDNLII